MKTVAVIAGFFFLFVLISTASAAGPGFSGVTANADSAETAATNPAGMTRIKKPSIYGNPMILYTKSETEFNASDTGTKNTISDDGWVAMPGLYYVHPLCDRWVIGIGPNGASGLGTTYDDEWAGRYLIEEWSLLFAGIAPAVAYRLNDKLSLGASLPIMYSQFELKKAVYNLDPEAEDGSFKLDMDGWGVGGTFGILYELTDCTRLGVVYRSKVSVTDKGNPEFSGLTPEREELLNKFGALNQDISLDTSTPPGRQHGCFS
jgi:long-chain fatty acid transport protein